MRIQITPEKCCGCMACKDVCPTHAIEKREDERGFLIPVIRNELCIDCGACQRVCAFAADGVNGNEIKSAFAFQLSNWEQLRNSTSGGAFTALSDQVLRNGGMVAGAVMDDDFLVHHDLARDGAGRDRMRQSKYVQSDTDGIFGRVKDCLDGGQMLLFVGTPCQCAQLRQYLGRTYDNLLICDFLCHGVPGNALFRDHVAWLEKTFGQKAVSYSFRGKRYGWNHGIDEVTFSDGTGKDTKDIQLYTHFFQKNLSLRESCLSCKYRQGERCSDITMADFWGHEKVLGRTDRRGLSLVTANTEKGRAMLEAAGLSGDLTEVSVDQIMGRFTATPTRDIQGREGFWDIYQHGGYAALVARYGHVSGRAALKFELKKACKRAGLLLSKR